MNKSIWHRLLFQDNFSHVNNVAVPTISAIVNEVIPTFPSEVISGGVIPSEAVPSGVIPSEAVPSGAMTGGEKKPFKIDLDSKGMYIFMQLFKLFLIFYIAVILALVTMKSEEIKKLIFKDDDPDNNFSDPNFIFEKRWTKIIRYTAIFIAFIILYTIIILLVIYIYCIMKVEGDNQMTKAWDLLFVKLFQIKYKTTTLDVKYFIKLYICVVLLLFVMFLLYFRWNTSFFKSIYYQNISDLDSDNPAPELSQPEKYIHYYAVLILIIMLFVLLIVNLDQVMFATNDVFTFIIIAAFIIILMTMSIYSIKNILYKNAKKAILYNFLGILLPILVFLYFNKLMKKIIKKDI